MTLVKSLVQSVALCCIMDYGWLGGLTVRASDLRSGSRGFDSRPGRYQAT